MLVLTRKTDEQILIGENIKITLVRVRGNNVRIGIDAPRDIRVVRGELDLIDSKSGGQAGIEVDDREQSLLHEDVRMLKNRLRKAQPSTIDPISEATTPHMFVGRVRPAGDEENLDRPPLAGFLSAT